MAQRENVESERVDIQQQELSDVIVGADDGVSGLDTQFSIPTLIPLINPDLNREKAVEAG